MIEIELNNIKKNFGLKNILDGFNLVIKTGERVALIGQNGSGKSTILKIIAKQENIDNGTIIIRNGAKIGILKQIYENEKEEFPVKDFLYESFEEILKIEKRLNELEIAMSLETDNSKMEKLVNEYGRVQERYFFVGGYEVLEKFKKICSKFYIDEKMLKQNYNFLSGGEKTRVNLAKLLLKEPDILLLDEPTNHLDINTREILENALQQYKGTLLFVSHDRFFINKIANRILNIEDFKIKSYDGNYSDFKKFNEN